MQPNEDEETKQTISHLKPLYIEYLCDYSVFQISGMHCCRLSYYHWGVPKWEILHSIHGVFNVTKKLKI